MKSENLSISMKSKKLDLPVLLSLIILTMCLMTGCGSNSDTAQNSGENTSNATGNPATDNSATDHSATVTSGNTVGNQPVNVGENLTQEEAQSIALEAAGLTADSVTGLRTEYEVDDGVPLYEVQFYHENTEYDYTIHAQTGEILSYDVDDRND